MPYGIIGPDVFAGTSRALFCWAPSCCQGAGCDEKLYIAINEVVMTKTMALSSEHGADEVTP